MGFFTNYSKLCKEQNQTPTGIALKLGISASSVSKWKKGAVPKSAILNDIADYFGVSVDYLLGNTEIKNTPYRQSPREIAQVALFGGGTDVTDEMWDELQDFANYIKAKHRKG